MRALFNKLALIICALAAFSCASGKTDPSGSYETFNEQVEAYSKDIGDSKLITNFEDIPKYSNLRKKMAPGFLFYLYHPSDEKLRGRYRANFKGDLRLPYNVVIDVRGKTFSQLREEVLSSYSKFFQRGVENVDFKLLRMDYFVEVRGYVKNSGRYLVGRNEGVDKVIDKAGGLRGDLQQNFYKVSITQQGETYSISLNQYFQNSKYTNAFNWTGGDKVFVTELDESEMTGTLPIITILAGVNNPGKTLYKPNAHLFYYIGKMGGAINNIDYDESYILRTNKDGVYSIHFNLMEADELPALAPNDIVMLQAEKQSFSDLVWSRLTQVATIITSLAILLAI